MRTASVDDPAAVSLQAVLFDMDGLLIDSEPHWLAAETATVRELGGVWGSRQNLELHGTNLPVAADYMIRYTGSDLTRSVVMNMLCRNMTTQLAGGVSFRPGAMELLTGLAMSEVVIGLVTSGVREHVDVVLGQLPEQLFDVTVTADDVEQLKPHPQPYLTAMDALQVEARRTVVLEDSPPGVASGEAAGCHVVAIPSVTTIPPGQRRTVVSSLTEVDLARLQSLIG